MIQSRTARKMMYDWHGGQTCPLYAAASSGLVANWDALLYACNCMKDSKEYPHDYAKLTGWIKHKQAKQKFSVVVQGQSYAVLPWVSRSYQWAIKMLIVRKNQLFDQEWQVCQYIKGKFIGVVSGMGRNAGTWDSTAKSKRTAQRWAKQCRRDDPKSAYRVETVS